MISLSAVASHVSLAILVSGLCSAVCRRAELSRVVCKLSLHILWGKDEEDCKESPHLWDNYSDYSETLEKNKQTKGFWIIKVTGYWPLDKWSIASKRFTGTQTYRCPPDGSFSLDALGFPELMASSEKSCLHNIYCCFFFLSVHILSLTPWDLLYQPAQSAITKYHRPGNLNIRIYFSQFWKLGSPRFRWRQIWFPVRILSLS